MTAIDIAAGVGIVLVTPSIILAAVFCVLAIRDFFRRRRMWREWRLLERLYSLRDTRSPLVLPSTQPSTWRPNGC